MRTLITILLLLSQVSCFSQAKIFKKVMAEERPYRGFYVFVNKKDKMVRLSDLVTYCKKMGWIVGESTEKNITRFGDVDKTVATFEFLPMTEYQNYVFDNLMAHYKATDLKTQGSAFFYSGNKDDMLAKKDNVYWSGTATNGKISGTGEGVYVEGSNYYSFNGTFQEGLPIGKLTLRKYTPSSKSYYFSKGSLQNFNYTSGILSEGMLSVQFGNQYGFVDTNGRTVVKPIYSEVKPFSGGTAIVTSENIRMKIDKTGKVTGLDKGQSLTIDQLASLAKSQPSLKKEIGEQLKSHLSKEKNIGGVMKIEKQFSSDYIGYFNEYKWKFYNNDSEKVKSYYQQMLQSIAQNGKGLNGSTTMPDKLISFPVEYADFDPNNMIVKAECVMQYLKLCICMDEPYYSSLFKLQETLKDANDFYSKMTLVYGSDFFESSVVKYFETTINKINSRIKVLQQKQQQLKQQQQQQNRTTNNNTTPRIAIEDINSSNIGSFIISKDYRSERRSETKGYIEEVEYEDEWGLIDYDVEDHTYEVPYTAYIYTVRLKDYYGNGSFTVTIENDTKKWQDAENYPYAYGDKIFKTLDAAIAKAYRMHYGK